MLCHHIGKTTIYKSLAGHCCFYNLVDFVLGLITFSKRFGLGGLFYLEIVLGFRRRVPDYFVLLVDDVRISQGGRSCVLLATPRTQLTIDKQKPKNGFVFKFKNKIWPTYCFFFEFGAPFRWWENHFFFFWALGQVSQAKVWRNDIPDITRANKTHTDKIWND